MQQDRDQDVDSHTPPEEPRKKLKRPRAAQACDACRARKARCDGNYPCGLCESETSSDLPSLAMPC